MFFYLFVSSINTNISSNKKKKIFKFNKKKIYDKVSFKKLSFFRDLILDSFYFNNKNLNGGNNINLVKNRTIGHMFFNSDKDIFYSSGQKEDYFIEYKLVLKFLKKKRFVEFLKSIGVTSNIQVIKFINVPFYNLDFFELEKNVQFDYFYFERKNFYDFYNYLIIRFDLFLYFFYNLFNKFNFFSFDYFFLDKMLFLFFSGNFFLRNVFYVRFINILSFGYSTFVENLFYYFLLRNGYSKNNLRFLGEFGFKYDKFDFFKIKYKYKNYKRRNYNNKNRFLRKIKLKKKFSIYFFKKFKRNFFK